MQKVKLEKADTPRATYQEAYAKAKSEGRLTRKTSRIHVWSDEGRLLTGKVRAIKPFTGGKFDAEVNAYLIETDEGLVSTIFGSYTDGQLEGLDLVGKVIHIEYDGKKDLEDGRKVNLFNVDVLDGGKQDGTD